LAIWNRRNKKETRKRVFISFAIEDVEYRDYLVDQARKKHSPFDFIDMSVKQKWNETEWKKKCSTKIKRCDGVIALLSKKHSQSWWSKMGNEMCN
jgi:hypothetical protein